MNKIEKLNAVTIYPNFDFRESNTHISVRTYIRKKKGRKWYLIPLVKEEQFRAGMDLIDRIKATRNFLSLFHIDAYKHLLFYIIDKSVIDGIDGRITIYEDAQQCSEEKRLRIKL